MSKTKTFEITVCEDDCARITNVAQRMGLTDSELIDRVLRRGLKDPLVLVHWEHQDLVVEMTDRWAPHDPLIVLEWCRVVEFATAFAAGAALDGTDMHLAAEEAIDHVYPAVPCCEAEAEALIHELMQLAVDRARSAVDKFKAGSDGTRPGRTENAPYLSKAALVG
jgi:hypothetical protein